jgi:hypothetical protein
MRHVFDLRPLKAIGAVTSKTNDLRSFSSEPCKTFNGLGSTGAASIEIGNRPGRFLVLRDEVAELIERRTGTWPAPFKQLSIATGREISFTRKHCLGRS